MSKFREDKMDKIKLVSQSKCSSDQVNNITEGTVDPSGNHINKSPNDLRCSSDQEQKTGIAPEECAKSRERTQEGLLRRLRQHIVRSRSGQMRSSMLFFLCCLQPAEEEDNESKTDKLQDQQVVLQRVEEKLLETKNGQLSVSEPIHHTKFPMEYKIGRFIVTKPNQEDNLVPHNKEYKMNKAKITKKKRQCVTDMENNMQEAKKRQFNVNKQMPKANLPEELNKGRFTITKANCKEHLAPENKEYRKSKPKVTQKKRRRMTDLERNIQFVEKTVWDFGTCPYSSESQ